MTATGAAASGTAAAGQELQMARQDPPTPDVPAHLPLWTRLGERWRDWRHRTVARPGFQRWAAAFPLTRPVARRHARELFDLVAGFVYSQVLLACVRLDLFERLAGGAVSEAALAAQLNLGDEALERLLAAAAALELVERRPGARVALGRLGAPMVGNRAVAAMVEHHATLYADLADPLALPRVLGEILTEPKPNVWFDSRDAEGPPDARTALQLDPRTRMAYDTRHVFVNGESFVAAGRDARLMRCLADARQLTARERRGLSAGAAELLEDWRAAGWLHEVAA